MPNSRNKYYIRERHNPQLGIYYVKMGLMTKKQAKGYEGPLYGSNVMLSYDTEEEYLAAVEALKEKGHKL